MQQEIPITVSYKFTNYLNGAILLHKCNWKKCRVLPSSIVSRRNNHQAFHLVSPLSLPIPYTSSCRKKSIYAYTCLRENRRSIRYSATSDIDKTTLVWSDSTTSGPRPGVISIDTESPDAAPEVLVVWCGKVRQRRLQELRRLRLDLQSLVRQLESSTLQYWVQSWHQLWHQHWHQLWQKHRANRQERLLHHSHTHRQQWESSLDVFRLKRDLHISIFGAFTVNRAWDYMPLTRDGCVDVFLSWTW